MSFYFNFVSTLSDSSFVLGGRVSEGVAVISTRRSIGFIFFLWSSPEMTFFFSAVYLYKKKYRVHFLLWTSPEMIFFFCSPASWARAPAPTLGASRSSKRARCVCVCVCCFLSLTARVHCSRICVFLQSCGLLEGTGGASRKSAYQSGVLGEGTGSDPRRKSMEQAREDNIDDFNDMVRRDCVGAEANMGGQWGVFRSLREQYRCRKVLADDVKRRADENRKKTEAAREQSRNALAQTTAYLRRLQTKYGFNSFRWCTEQLARQARSRPRS